MHPRTCPGRAAFHPAGMVRSLNAALVALTLLLAAGCNTPDVNPLDRLPAVSGSALYRERIALTPSAVLEVELLQLRAGAQPAVLGVATITNPGQVPIPFRVVYNPARIQPDVAHAVRARILEAGRVTWATEQPVAVLTHGAPTEGLELLLVRPAAP